MGGDGGMTKEKIGELMIVVPVGLFGIFCVGVMIFFHPWVCLWIAGGAVYLGTAYYLMGGSKYGDNGWYI